MLYFPFPFLSCSYSVSFFFFFYFHFFLLFLKTKSLGRNKPSNNSTTVTQKNIWGDIIWSCFNFFKSVDSNKIIQLTPWYFKRSFLHLLNLWCHLIWLLYKDLSVLNPAVFWEDVSVNSWKMFLLSFSKFLLHFITPRSSLKTKQSESISLLIWQDQPRTTASSLFLVCLHSSFVSASIFRLWALWDRGYLVLICVLCQALKQCK